MSESTLSAPHAELAAEIGHVLNYGRTYSSMTAAQQAEVDLLIEQAQRGFYFPPPLPNEAQAHSWSFLHPTTTLTTSAEYATGTVAIAAGVVTLSSGTFPSWAASGELTVSGSTYAVSTRDGDTQVTLVDTSVTVTAGATYSLQRVVYDVPDAFGGIEGGMTYRSNLSGSVRIPVVGEGHIRELRSRPGQSAGKPQVVAVRPKSGMLLTGQRFEFLLWPNADEAYILSYRYTYLADAIASSTTIYPLGGMAHSETMLASALYVANRYLQPFGEHTKQARAYFMERLAASVSHDRAGMSRTKYGYNHDRSDARHRAASGGLSHDSDLLVSYEGVFYEASP